MRPLYIFGFSPSSPLINVVLLRSPVSATNFSWDYNIEGGGELHDRLVSKYYVHDCSHVSSHDFFTFTTSIASVWRY